MKNARYVLVAALVTAGIVFVYSGSSAVQAQTPSGQPNGQGNGLKIAPVRTDLTMDKGSSRIVSVTVENITSFPLTLRGVTNDFIPSDDESGEPRIILDDKESAPGNSFKSLVGPLPTVTLKPAERREVRVSLAIPTDGTAGGYYGAIRFIPGTGESDKNVSLTASVGSIFLIRVPGAVNERLGVESFRITKDGTPHVLFDSGPVSMETRFKNFGNIHVQPFGKIFVKNFSGKVLQEIEINNAQPRGSILPTSVRKFESPIKQEKLFGRYTVEGSFGYGSSGELLLAKQTFYVVPFKLIAAIIGLILFLIFGLPRLIRAYNRSVIRRMGGTVPSKSRGRPAIKSKPKPPTRRTAPPANRPATRGRPRKQP